MAIPMLNYLKVQNEDDSTNQGQQWRRIKLSPQPISKVIQEEKRGLANNPTPQIAENQIFSHQDFEEDEDDTE